MAICARCGGSGRKRPSGAVAPYVVEKCTTCKGTGKAPPLPSGEYRLAHPSIAGRVDAPPVDRETMVPCPECIACPRCGGVHMVPKSAAG